jgi:hypothetical protein
MPPGDFTSRASETPLACGNAPGEITRQGGNSAGLLRCDIVSVSRYEATRMIGASHSSHGYPYHARLASDARRLQLFALADPCNPCMAKGVRHETAHPPLYPATRPL